MEDQRGNADLQNPCYLCMVSANKWKKYELVSVSSVHKLHKDCTSLISKCLTIAVNAVLALVYCELGLQEDLA
jgi:hypothetical protein